MKFKVDDVVVYSHNLYSSVRFKKGDIFKVTRVIGNGNLFLESIESKHEPCGSYTSDQFELVEFKPKFKVGDKVRCVDNSNYPNQLTVGKVYTVVGDVDHRFVRIVPDHHIEMGGFKVERFELVQEDAVLTPEEVFEHLRKGTKLEWRYKGNSKWQPCVNTGNVQVRCILDSEWRIKPEPEVIELNGKKYIEITE